ncbi:MAG: ABC transporter ATP-binding protein, partial [Gaiellaceae bacterium]
LEFLQALMDAVAEEGVTVVLTSHILSELERVCDHLVIVAAGGVQLAGSIDEILASHRLLSGPRRDPAAVARAHSVVQESHSERQTTLLVRTHGHVADATWQVEEVGLEEIVLAYLGQQASRPAPEPDALELAS